MSDAVISVRNALRDTLIMQQGMPPKLAEDFVDDLEALIRAVIEQETKKS